MTSHTAKSSDEFAPSADIGELCTKVRQAVKRSLPLLSTFLILEVAYLFFSQKPGAPAFALIALGTYVELQMWCLDAIGLPLLPILAIQGLVIYGVPIMASHDVLKEYSSDFVLDAGREVLFFDLAVAVAWRLGIQVFSPSPPVSYALQQFDKSKGKGSSKIGFALICSSTAYEVVKGLGLVDALLDLLPVGSSSILDALVAVVSASGFFLSSMTYSQSSAAIRLMFWILLTVNGMVTSSEFLLYAVGANLITIAIGFFWGSGRIPWRFLVTSMAILSFFNMGKTTMRDRYWSHDDYDKTTPVTFLRLPEVYAEWAGDSYNALLQNEDHQSSKTSPLDPQNDSATKNQTLLDRIDNLQNLLFVIQAIEVDHVKPLGGATYSLIPPLLIPRIIWPNKPRTHEGQIILNVHFGRQSIESTVETYIAWGILPEAYGNFGPVLGAIIIGAVIGFCFAWIENLTVRKLVLSMEGFLSLTLVMSVVNSFEMVASVLVTSTFQAMMVVTAASMPFVRRTVTRRAQKDKRWDEPTQPN